MLSCALGLLACGDGTNAVSGQLHGTVRNASNGKPVSGAHVEFTSDTLDRASAKTNADGHYDVFVNSRVPRGRIQVSKSGYQTTVASVYLDDDDVQLDVDLPPH